MAANAVVHDFPAGHTEADEIEVSNMLFGLGVNGWFPSLSASVRGMVTPDGGFGVGLEDPSTGRFAWHDAIVPFSTFDQAEAYASACLMQHREQWIRDRAQGLHPIIARRLAVWMRELPLKVHYVFA